MTATPILVRIPALNEKDLSNPLLGGTNIVLLGNFWKAGPVETLFPIPGASREMVEVKIAHLLPFTLENGCTVKKYWHKTDKRTLLREGLVSVALQGVMKRRLENLREIAAFRKECEDLGTIFPETPEATAHFHMKRHNPMKAWSLQQEAAALESTQRSFTYGKPEILVSMDLSRPLTQRDRKIFRDLRLNSGLIF